MKKSRILFIITIIFVAVTIGLFFYKNSCHQKEDEFLEEHMTDDVKLEWHEITQSDIDRAKRQEDELYKARETSDIIFNVAVGITTITLASGVVLFIIEKKKNR